MRLELDREDMLESKRDIACSKTIFGDFKPKVKAAIKLIGKATFYDDKGSRIETYNVIYPPKKAS